MHDGDLILFNLEDYQPYEPENCLHEAYLFCDIIIDDKPVDHYALTASQYDAMTATVRTEGLVIMRMSFNRPRDTTLNKTYEEFLDWLSCFEEDWTITEPEKFVFTLTVTEQ